MGLPSVMGANNPSKSFAVVLPIVNAMLAQADRFDAPVVIIDLSYCLLPKLAIW